MAVLTKELMALCGNLEVNTFVIVAMAGVALGLLWMMSRTGRFRPGVSAALGEGGGSSQERGNAHILVAHWVPHGYGRCHVYALCYLFDRR